MRKISVKWRSVSSVHTEVRPGPTLQQKSGAGAFLKTELLISSGDGPGLFKEVVQDATVLARECPGGIPGLVQGDFLPSVDP